MKNLAFLLLLMIATSCVVTTETPTNIKCWKRKICTGDTYTYHRYPGPHNSYTTEVITVIDVRNDRARIRRHDGDEHWVYSSDLYDNSQGEHVRYAPRGPGNRGRGHAYGHDK